MNTKLMGFGVAAAMIVLFGAGIVSAETLMVAKLDTKPGPAFQVIQGKLANIEGNTYVVEQSVDNYRGETVTNEVRVYVGKDTMRLTGNKKIGDKIRVEVTKGGFANAIQ
jgi:outer membrane lipoprotein-sorting protein